MVHLFTYGSLMCSDIMLKVAGCRTDFTRADLGGFFRSRIRDQEYPGIVPQPDARVSGIVYFDLSPESMHRLDIFEGELYRRQEVEVMVEVRGTVAAMVYVLKPRYKALLTGEEWSFADFLSAGKKKFEDRYGGFREL